ncbi:hypothetical protein V8C86DRAFT_2724287 [Haematococcus lacustris]
MQDSPLCEVLGRRQRAWLQAVLGPGPGPPPALRLVASGSVLLGSLGYESPGALPADRIQCSGDDWVCYQPAQTHFLHTVANASGPGCVVVLTGDYHYGDIKVAQPGGGWPYSAALSTAGLQRPVYQLMSSGLTASTASGGPQACEGSYHEDLVALRPPLPSSPGAGNSSGGGGDGRCAYAPQPNFGLVEVDWEARVVRLQIRNAADGTLAVAKDGRSQMSLALSLDSCRPLP